MIDAEMSFKIQEGLAEKIFNRQAARQPELNDYLPVEKEKCLRDIEYHLDFLKQAYQVSSPKLMADYMRWNRIVFEQRSIPIQPLELNLIILQEVIAEQYPAEISQSIAPLLESARQVFTAPLPAPESFLCPEQPFAENAAQYLQTVLTANRHSAVELIDQFIQQGMEVKDIYLHVFQPVQNEIGRLWQINKISVAQEHYATAVTQLTMAQLYPRIFSAKRNGYRMVAACVGSELHEIGIRMVADFFEMEGWDTFYLGANVPAQSIVGAVQQQNANLLALSVTLTSHIGRLESLIQEIRGSSASNIKILVGGYPFNIDPEIWRRIGADGYAPNALQAIQTAEKLIK